MNLRIRLRLLAPLAAAAFVVLAAALVPARAAVPNKDAVPAYAEEQTIQQIEQGLPAPGWGSAASGIEHFDRHFIVPPGRLTEQDVVLQRGGNTWRVLRNGPFALGAGVLLIVVLLAIFFFYTLVGPTRIEEPETGRPVVRFTGWQRLIHWTTAIAFVVLAFTGIVILFGKDIMMPWMGHVAFAWLAIISKWLHNVAGPLFLVFSVLIFLTYARYNFLTRADWLWLRKVGGMFTHQPVPAGYVNAGEKLFFWGAVTILGLFAAVTGLMLDFPYFGQVGAVAGISRYLLQWADYVHLAVVTLYIAVVLGHAYLGTIGTPGTWHAMRYGTVDESWARAHNRLWYEELRNAPRSAPPLGSGGAR